VSTYEIIVSTIAATNLVITLAVMVASRGKAASARVDELAMRVERMDAVVAAAPRHEDLSAIYQSLNESRQQMERLSGEVTQMNANLRMVLNQLMKTL
jgi:hypothetical protein